MSNTNAYSVIDEIIAVLDNIDKSLGLPVLDIGSSSNTSTSSSTVPTTSTPASTTPSGVDTNAPKPTPMSSSGDSSTSSSTNTSPTIPSTSTTSLADEIINYAKKFIGCKYTWGGESPTTGFDCSGFVQYVFAHFGIDLPRTTYTQVNEGEVVQVGDEQPGDLVFEIGSSTAPQHVGIYLGNGKIINAMNPQNGVCISALYEVVAVRNVMPATKTSTNDKAYTLYTVTSGDTLTDIAEEYGVTVAELQEWNNIVNPNNIQVGEVLKIYLNNSGNSTSDANPNPTGVASGMYGQVVGTSACNVYSNTTGETIVGSLEVGQRFYISSVDGDMYGISKPVNGYISASQSYVQTTNITSVSNHLVNFTASWEGFDPDPYKDAGGNWTVGYGHCTYGVKPPPETQAEAWQQLEQTLQSFATDVASTYGYLNMPQWQFDAVVDFCFNLGFGSFQESDLLTDMTSCQNNATITGDFTAWSYCGSTLLQGLYRRRQAEAEMFLFKEYNNN